MSRQQQISASAQALAHCVRVALDVRASQRPNEFLAVDTWQVARQQLLITAARQQPTRFRAVFSRFFLGLRARPLPVSTVLFFDAVRAGDLSPGQAAELLAEILPVGATGPLRPFDRLADN